MKKKSNYYWKKFFVIILVTLEVGGKTFTSENNWVAFLYLSTVIFYLLNYEIYLRGRVSRFADTELLLLIAHLTRPQVQFLV